MSDYWARVRQRAAELGSDGCSVVADFYLDACLEHDIHYRTHRRLDGTPITKAEADALFRQRIQERSCLGRFSPMSWWRWAAVALFGGSAWGEATPVPALVTSTSTAS
ncbi:MAG TPA: hypothetical protein VEA38_00920 [Terriglobales bacterium]|nr:hypothetical protein [Terriglobales bacterium]